MAPEQGQSVSLKLHCLSKRQDRRKIKMVGSTKSNLPIAQSLSYSSVMRQSFQQMALQPDGTIQKQGILRTFIKLSTFLSVYNLSVTPTPCRENAFIFPCDLLHTNVLEYLLVIAKNVLHQSWQRSACQILVFSAQLFDRVIWLPEYVNAFGNNLKV